MKTSFSFEVSYPAPQEAWGSAGGAAGGAASQTGEVMQSLQSLLQDRFGALDPAARVQVTGSRSGASRKMIELVTTLQDGQIAGVLSAFCEMHGVVIKALE